MLNLRLVIEKLPLANRVLLRELCIFLKELSAYEKRTLMGTKNLATVFGPNILRDKSDDPIVVASTMGIINVITDTMITRCDEVFYVHAIDPWDFVSPSGAHAVAIGLALHDFEAAVCFTIFVVVIVVVSCRYNYYCCIIIIFINIRKIQRSALLDWTEYIY